MTPALLWFLVGIGFFAAELITPGLVLLFFGIGSWAAACAALIGLTVNIQFGVFFVVSIAALVFLRRKVRGIFSGGDRNATSGEESGAAHPMLGRRGIVSQALTPGKSGEINISGSFWRAQSEEPLGEGRAVVVRGTLAGDSLMLLVASEGDE